MENLKNLLKNRVPERNIKLHSEAHLLADEISQAFGERKRFAQYLGMIKRAGVERARAVFSEIRGSTGIRNPGAVFMSRMKKNPEKKASAPPSPA